MLNYGIGERKQIIFQLFKNFCKLGIIIHSNILISNWKGEGQRNEALAEYFTMLHTNIGEINDIF